MKARNDAASDAEWFRMSGSMASSAGLDHRPQGQRKVAGWGNAGRRPAPMAKPLNGPRVCQG